MCKLSQMNTVWRQMSIDVGIYNVDWFVQERRNSIANALELFFIALTHRYIFICFEQAVTRLYGHSEDFSVAWQ